MPRVDRSNRAGWLWPLMTFVALVAPPAGANWWGRSAQPVDSAYWWTLSASVTPNALQAELVAPEVNRERYRQSNPEAPPNVVEAVETFLDGSRTPELVPAWIAFSAFAHRFEEWTGWEPSCRRQLEGHGISTAGIDRIVEAALGANDREASLRLVVVPPFQELAELTKDAAETVGEQPARAAFEARDAATLAGATGRTVAEVEALFADGLRSPAAEAAVAELVALEADLAPEDWRVLVGYLRSEVAVGVRVFELPESATNREGGA